MRKSAMKMEDILFAGVIHSMVHTKNADLKFQKDILHI